MNKSFCSSAVGSHDALASLLRSNALRAALYAISNLRPSDSLALKSALCRVLKVLATAIADTVGPSLWGVRPDSSPVREEAKAALDYLFHVCILLRQIQSHPQ